MKKHIALALAAAVTVASATAAFAHHSFSMFDSAQEIVVKGKVVRWAFTSPHTFMIMENDADGEVWAFEGAAPPNQLVQNPPMNGDTFKPGQQITITMCPLRDGRNGGAIGLIFDEAGNIYTPADGGCRGGNNRKEQWAEWIAKGYMSKAEAEAAEGTEAK